MLPSTDTNTTLDQWSYLYKNTFCVIILILKHVLFRLMQNTLDQGLQNEKRERDESEKEEKEDLASRVDSEIPQPGNQLSFMLHELVFLGCHLQFASYS